MLAGPGWSPRTGRPGEGLAQHSESCAWPEAHEGVEGWVLKWAAANQERWEATSFGLDGDGCILSKAQERDQSVGMGAQESEVLERL